MRAVLNVKQKQSRIMIVAELNTSTDDFSPFEINASAVVAAFAGCPAIVWQAIDDAIGNAERIGLDRPHLVRQVRNHPIYGRLLLAGLGN